MSQKQLSLPALNVQWPWGTLILSGKKKVETRSYPMPAHYVDKQIFIVETPGVSSKKKREEGAPSKSHIIGIVVFGQSFKYLNKQLWERDKNLHLVEINDPDYGFSMDKEKWGWPVKHIEIFSEAVSAPAKRGIRFTAKVTIKKLHKNISKQQF